MLTRNDWQTALRDAVAEVLQQAGCAHPPVNAVALARAMQLTVVLDRGQAGRGRIKRIGGQPAIFLKPDARPERLQWAVAHELGEHLVGKVCRSLGLDGADLSPRQREDLANQFARELLLPFEWFQQDCAGCVSDLPRLKARYATASHELIAWRWLDLEPPAIVTIFDQKVQTHRRGNGPNVPPPLTTTEYRCWELLRRRRIPSTTQEGPLTVRGWCIDSPGWEREILYAAWNGED